MRPDIAPGAVFPDYELPDHTGKPRRLSEIQAGDPMIIVGWHAAIARRPGGLE